MSGLPRIVAGVGTAAGGAHATLAVRIGAHAQRCGFVLSTIEASRSMRSSCSKYVHLRDVHGQHWIVRVSDHRWPARQGHPRPSLDVVSIDGVAGFDAAADFLTRAYLGAIVWVDPHAGVRQRKQRRRR